MGATGFESRISLPGNVSGACVLLIDGLGAELLDAHAEDAPVLAGLRGQTLSVGFPSTTAAGLAAVGTGCRSGEHGMVGYTFRLPGAGVVNALSWRPHPWGDDLRDTVEPERVQPIPTTFERATSSGIAVSVVSGGEVRRLRADPRRTARRPLRRRARDRRPGLVRAHRGRRRRVLLRLSRRPRHARTSVRPGFGGVAHAAAAGRPTGGVGGRRLAARRVARRGGRSRHGRRRAVGHGRRGCASCAARQACRPSAARHAPATSTPRTGRPATCSPRGGRRWPTGPGWCRATRRSAPAGSAPASPTTCGRASATSWRPPRGSAAMVRRTVEPLESALVGHHGSLTTAEQRVPLLLAYG